MPTPKTDEKKSEFIARCIPEVRKEGKAIDQAIAICNSIWENKGGNN